MKETTKGENGSLKGCCLYYDGQFNDSRMAVALAMTAASAGAVVVNHCQVRASNAKRNSAPTRIDAAGDVAAL